MRYAADVAKGHPGARARDEALSILVGTFNSVLSMFALSLEARKTQLEGQN